MQTSRISAVIRPMTLQCKHRKDYPPVPNAPYRVSVLLFCSIILEKKSHYRHIQAYLLASWRANEEVDIQSTFAVIT